MDRPVIFLSAVSGEFRELRQLLHDSFKTHFHVITQDDTLHQFPGGDVRQLLSDAIDGSHAVLHLAGAGFGSTAAAPFPEMPGFLCSWTQYEYYYAHSFDADPARRKQIFAIVCGPTLRSPTFTEKDDATLTAAQKAPLQEAHCQRIFSGKFDATPLASLPRTVNHGQPINDNAAALRAAIDICAQLATRQPAFQSACALVQVSLQDQLQPLLDAQLRIEKKQKRLLLLSLCTLAALALIGGGIFLLRSGQENQEIIQKNIVEKLDEHTNLLKDQSNLLQEAVVQLEQLTEEKSRLGIKITDLPLETVEKELADRVGVSAVELRLNIEAGKKSQDALTRAHANLLAGNLADAHTAAREVRDAETPAIQRIIQSHQVDGQAYYQEVKYGEALESYKKAAALVDKEKAPLAWADAQGRITLIQLYTTDYSQAESMMREILRINEEKRGPSAAETAAALNDLAQLLKATNRPAAAEPLMRRALEIDEVTSGKNHPNVAIRLNNLAGLLLDTNRLPEAEPLMRRALEIDEASYGKDHPKVAIRLSNLAQLLQDTDRLAEAKPLMRRALEIDEAYYGKAHPMVAFRLNNLAHLLRESNRLTQAEPLMRRVISIFEAANGKTHPNVATALNNLAELLQATKRFAEAEPLMRRALDITEDSYGKAHPDVAISLNNLALLLQATKRLVEAEPLMRRALDITEDSYGKAHPKVAISLNNLGLLLEATNRLAEAEPLMGRAVAIFLRFQAQTGHRNPGILTALGNYLRMTRALKLPDAVAHARLDAEREQAGLEPAAFEALWAEALAKNHVGFFEALRAKVLASNYTGPYLVTVDEAVAGSQGIALGIQPGDVILRYHGEAITSITSIDQFIQLTGEVKDEAIPLEIQRGKEILKLTAQPGKLGLKIQNVMPPAPAE